MQSALKLKVSLKVVELWVTVHMCLADSRLFLQIKMAEFIKRAFCTLPNKQPKIDLLLGQLKTDIPSAPAFPLKQQKIDISSEPELSSNILIFNCRLQGAIFSRSAKLVS